MHVTIFHSTNSNREGRTLHIIDGPSLDKNPPVEKHPLHAQKNLTPDT